MRDAIDNLRQEIKWLQDTILERDKQLTEARALLEEAAEGFADDWDVSEFTAKARAFLQKNGG